MRFQYLLACNYETLALHLEILQAVTEREEHSDLAAPTAHIADRPVFTVACACDKSLVVF